MTTIYLSPPDVGEVERDALLRAFDSGWVAPAGPELDGFEKDLSEVVGWPGVVALSSGTAALHLGLMTAGVQPGDAVFVSDLTFAASANAITYCGAQPQFIDSDRATWNLDPAVLADALADARRRNRLPAAVVVVDLYGQCADYDAIVPQCEELGIPVIEDAAEALGATYRGRPAGTLGTAGVFSFNGNKIMTTSGGGAYLTPDVSLARRVRHLATQAREPAVHYEHVDIGFNYRLSNLLAAMGRAQLSRLAAMSRRRLAIHEMYRAALGDLDVSFMPRPDWSGWNGWLTCVLFDSTQTRDSVMAALTAVDVESRPLWKPMHAQPVFADAVSWTTGVGDDLFARGLCLPSGSALTDEQIEFVAATVRSVLIDQR